MDSNILRRLGAGNSTTSIWLVLAIQIADHAKHSRGNTRGATKTTVKKKKKKLLQATELDGGSNKHLPQLRPLPVFDLVTFPPEQ